MNEKTQNNFESEGRRNFLKRMALTSGVLAVGSSAFAKLDEPVQTESKAIGVPRGMPGKEGRVVWQHEPKAVSWNGNGFWWADSNIDQKMINRMFSDGIRNLTDAKNDHKAWDAMFKHFNSGLGYKPGEQIAIKINLNCASAIEDNDIDATQHTILALLESLINGANIPAECITVYDATHNTRFTRGRIPARIYKYCTAQQGKFLDVKWVSSYETEGVTLKSLTDDVLHYSVTDNNQCGKQIPNCVKDAKYLINMALLKAHDTCGYSLTAKNHYGTINQGKDHKYIDPLNTEFGGPVPKYSPLVDLIASPELGGKTLLFMIDGLMGCLSSVASPVPWTSEPFDGHYPSSFLFSLDPIAIDSVGGDLIRHTYDNKYQTGKDERVTPRLAIADNYLHEGALIEKAPSGINYQHDGLEFKSLGVHEHANFGTSKISERYKTIQLLYNQKPV